MKKLFSLIIAIIAVTLTANAQMSKPGFGASQPKAGSWTSWIEMKSSKTGVVVMKLYVNRGWHIYGPEVSDDGPRPMIFDFSDSKGVEFTGTPTPSKAPESGVDDMFDVKVTYWDTSVTFKMPFKVVDAKNAKISGTIKYQGCNDRICTMPQTETIDLKLPK